MKIRLFTIPNLITLGNLLCGALAVVVALRREDLPLAFALIVLAAVFDFFDGMVARRLGQEGPLGIQLDSLADDISFGLAPAAVLYVWYGQVPAAWLSEASDALAYGVFVFAACAALRLAKFNVDDTQHTEFCGLPSPAAALLCASAAAASRLLDLPFAQEGVLLLALAAALLMVSPVRMFSFKFAGFGWRGNGLRYCFAIFAAAALAAGLLLCGWRGAVAAVPAIIGAYVAVSALRWLCCAPAGGASSDL